MQEKLDRLTTEQVNQNTRHIDDKNTLEIISLMNKEDENTVAAVKAQLPNIAAAIDVIAERLSDGGRLFYVGSGTSGRLGVLDASECPPTFGVSPEMVQGIMSGGPKALYSSELDNMEDDPELGKTEIVNHNVNSRDVVVGITASGRTPFVKGALEKAGECGAFTIGLCNNATPVIGQYCKIVISLPTGPETIVGSTRLKAGTSQKMVLNMLSTGTMIKLGKVYDNYMVDVMTVNEKLVVRATRMICEITGVDSDTAGRYLKEAEMNVKLAICMIMGNYSKEQAGEKLNAAKGHLSQALREK